MSVIFNPASVGGGGAGTGVVTYYVSPTGNDGALGTSPGTAWQTIGKVNGATFTPGNSILFQGGQTFSGALVNPGGGTAAQPITFGSYGGGRATISSGASAGFISTNFPGVIVRDLIFTGTANTATDGIEVVNSLTNTQLQNVQVINCTVSGYGINGIHVDSVVSTGTSGFDDVLIEGCTVSGCTTSASASHGSAGIFVQGLRTGVVCMNDVLVQNCYVHDNPGNAATPNWSGSGIVLAGTTNSTIQNCFAYNNGTNGPGSVGIWFFYCSQSTIANCTVDTHRSGTNTDGDGYDLDGGCLNCTIIDCYSRNCDGAGYYVFSYDTGFAVKANDSSAIINCVSDNDGKHPAGQHAGISISNFDLTSTLTNVHISGCRIYNNNTGCDCINVLATNPNSITGLVANCDFTCGPTASNVVNIAGNPTGLLFQGNKYMSSGSAPTILWNGVTYTSVPAWATAITGQETSSCLSTVALNSGSLVLDGSTSGAVTLKSQAAAGTWTMQLPTSGGTSGYVLQTNGAGLTSWASAGAATVAIGSTITGGTTGSALFIGAASALAQNNANFFWDDTNFFLKLGNASSFAALYLNSLPAIYEVPNAIANNWFEGNAGNTTVTGSGNFGTGDGALAALTTGSDNVAIGSGPLQDCTTGGNNVALGTNALHFNITGVRNTGVGNQALLRNQDGDDNFAFGFAAMANSFHGSQNCAVGTSALTSLSGANGNTAIGYGAMASWLSGNYNVGVGDGAGSPSWASGAGNVIIGTFAANNITGGSQNTLIGAWEGPSGSISNVIALTDGGAIFANSGIIQGVDYNYTVAKVWSFQNLANTIGLHVYNTTDGGAPPTNYERAVLDWNLTSNVFRLASQKGGTGTVRLIAVDGFQKAGAPAAGDLPTTTWTVINDTSGGQTWLVYNNAGTIRKVQLV